MSLTQLAAYYDEVSRCSRCGFCQPTCPTYKLEDGEMDVARGRNTLVRAVIEGRATLDSSSIGMIDECLRCGACVTACFAGVRTDRIMAAARSHYVETVGRGKLLRWMMEKLLPRRALMSRLLKAAAWSKKLGLSKAARLLSWAGPWGRGLARAESMTGAVPTEFFSSRIKPGTRLEAQGARKTVVGYFVGCRTEFLYPQLGEKTVEVLRRLGAEVVLLEEPATCCGLPPYSYGYEAATRALVRQNVLAFDALPCDFVVTEIGSCYHFLKEYGELYGADPEFGEAAKRVSKKVMYLADFIAHFGLEGEARLGSYAHTVTYQDSCQLVHLQKTSRAPREVLKSLEGIDFREMNEAAWCCGGAGAYTFTHPEQAEPMLQRKLANIKECGAREVVVGCQSCYLQISHGVKEAGMDVKVKHLVEVVEEAGRR